MNQRGTLRAQIASGDLIVAPGVDDGIGAMLAQQAGFPALRVTGAGMAASLGYSDFGLVAVSEMVADASAEPGIRRLTVDASDPSWPAARLGSREPRRRRRTD